MSYKIGESFNYLLIASRRSKAGRRALNNRSFQLSFDCFDSPVSGSVTVISTVLTFNYLLIASLELVSGHMGVGVGSSFNYLLIASIVYG